MQGDFFSADDHDRLVRLDEWRDEVMAKLEAMAIGQRALPRKTARRVASATRKRDAILIGIGALIGSSLGTGAAGLIQKALAALVGAH